jgi:hypothetical protein
MRHFPIPETAKTEVPANPVVEQLKAARELISDPEHWCRGAYARRKNGSECNSWSKSAHSFCALGAFRGYGDNAWRTLNLAAKNMGFLSAHHLNDSTDHATVMEMFDRAIEHAESNDV